MGRIARMRVGRGWRLGNPLRHDPRRREIARTARRARLIVILFLFMAIPAALFAGGAVRGAAIAESLAQSASSHEVTATLLVDATDEETVAAELGSVTARARWSAPHGRQRTGVVPVLPGATAGSAVPVWVDRSGTQVSAPLTADQAFWRDVLVSTLVMFGALVLALFALRLVRYRLDKRRYAAWAVEWREIEPRWTHRT